MTDEEYIEVRVADSAATRTPTLGGGSPGGATDLVEKIPVDALANSVRKLSGAMDRVLKDLGQVGDYRLSEVQLQIEVSAEGRLILIGGAGVKGGMMLSFKPAKDDGLLSRAD